MRQVKEEWTCVPALRVTKLSMHFGALKAIDEIDLFVPAGERHALLGTNGAGKTTLFNTIAGDLRASLGRIEYFGRDITRMPPHQRVALGLGRTYQTPLLFSSLSVRHNLIIAARGARAGGFSIVKVRDEDEASQRAMALAGRCGLSGFEQTCVSDLSHGQKKQLELAMALACDPKVLLLDEPAAGLSPQSRKDLIQIVRELPRELTLIFVEHDMEVALSLAEVVTVMKDGKVVARGLSSEIRANAYVKSMYLGDAAEVVHDC